MYNKKAKTDNPVDIIFIKIKLSNQGGRNMSKPNRKLDNYSPKDKPEI